MPRTSPLRAIGLTLALAFASSALYGAPVPDAAITEFVADNSKSLDDSDGDASDWLEIWNASGEPGDIGGYYLTDDPANLTKWQLPAAEFNAAGYIIVFASGKDRNDPAAELHTNFRLDASAGGYLALVKPDRVTLASEFAAYPKQYEDVGYGTGFGEPVPVDFVKAGDAARWHVPTGELAGWSELGFDDAAWANANTGIGYDNAGGDYIPLLGEGGNVREVMRGNNASIYIRIPFQLDEPAGISDMVLRMKWEDGFIAYLNGTEIYREDVPANATWNSAATRNRPSEDDAVTFFDYPVGGALVAGTNVLAIHGMNNSTGSSDVLFVPELVARQQDLSNPQPGYFIDTTPADTNGTRLDGLVGDTQFSVKRGFYNEAFALEITTATEGAEIRYTDDGSAPSETSGTVYSGPIQISDTTVIRAMAHKPGFEPTNIDTQTYLFPADVYGADFVDALTAVPTISLVTDNKGFENEGAANIRTEHQTSIEMIFPDGTPGFQEDGGLSNFGGRFTNFRKKSFRVAFRGEYGATKLRYPIFDGFDYKSFPPVEEFDAINLRSGSHDMQRRGAYMATRFVDDTMLDMGNIAPHGRFVHVYLNSRYWGQFHLRERWNADMAANYFGGSKEDYDAIAANNSGSNFETGTPYDGTAAFWTETRNLVRGPDPFVNAADHIDIPNVVDFMLLWTSGECESEFRAFGSKPLGVPFKFMVRDPDGYMPASGWSHSHPVTHQGPISVMTELRSGGNPDYDIMLADRIHKHFFNDGALTADESVERLRRRFEEARPGFAAEARRWGFRTVASWEGEVNRWLNNGLPQRTPSMIQKFKQAGMYPDIIAPVFSQHGGSIAPGAGITMSTNATAVYYTLDGADPRLSGGAISPAATRAPFESDVPTPQDFLVTGQIWNYLADGSDQGTEWRASDYDDAAWPSGPSQLGYNDTDNATDVGFVDTNPATGTQRNATTYFRTTVELSNPEAYSFFVVRLKYDDGAAVYANGIEIVRTSNLPANAAFDTFASSGTPNENAFFDFEVPSSRFVDGINTLAVEVHNSSASSSDVIFDLILRGEVDTTNGNNVTQAVVIPEPSLLRARAYNISDGGWSALSEAFFSIGSEPANASNLVISELHYHPAEPTTAAELAVSADRDNYEFIEFLNQGNSPIDLTGVSFTDGINFTFPNHTLLDPGQRVVIVRHPEAFAARYANAGDMNIAGQYSGRLNNDGERIAVVSTITGDILELTYNDQLPWPTIADGLGHSLVLTGADPGSAESWGAHEMIGGAPGEADTVVSSGYLAWKNANNITNDSGDSDDDTLKNLAEYAFGSDPRAVDPSSLPQASVATIDGSQYLTISYQKSLTVSDVQIVVQRGSDLEQWATAEDMVLVSEVENPGGQTATVTLRSAEPINPDNDTFLRIEVSVAAQ